MPKTSDDVNQHDSATNSATIHKIGRSASRRGESLAARIEEGAAGLVAFAEGLSDAEWHTPVSATDQRSVGVVVHHVASMYPIEIDLARAVACGRSVSDVTWEVRTVECQTCSKQRSSVEVCRARTLAAEQPRGGRCGASLHGSRTRQRDAVLAEFWRAGDGSVRY
jgi:hypothetical protein